MAHANHSEMSLVPLRCSAENHFRNDSLECQTRQRDKEQAMQIDIKQHTLDLADEGLLSIRDGQATRIQVQEGTLWITEEGDVKDTVLGRGEAYTIRRPGLAVLTALGASRITIDGPAREQRSARRIPADDLPALASCA
jgi:hypothetical protein